jgi:hypothetical protein
METKQKPVKEVRIGHVKAAVWSHKSETGTRYSVTLSRIWKDGDTWKSTDGFGRDDLLILAKVADQTHTWLCQTQAEERTEK